jgi:hypothetical protein
MPPLFPDCQGEEAGGHIMGHVSTMVLVPAVVEAVKPTPVLAGEADTFLNNGFLTR